MPNMIPTNRQLLRAMGMGESTASIVIPYMAISPATTDPKATQVMTLVSAIQRAVYVLGARDVPRSGRLDPSTVAVFRRVAGPDWERMPWAETVRAVVQAKVDGASLAPAEPMDDGMPVATSGTLDFLPDVPGGALTYAAVGYLVYRYFRGHK